MADWRELTEKEKQEIVKEYKKKYYTAMSIKIIAVLFIGLIILAQDYLHLRTDTVSVLSASAMIVYGIGIGMKSQLMKCPVCGGKFHNTRYSSYPEKCPHCGVVLADKFPWTEHRDNS